MDQRIHDQAECPRCGAWLEPEGISHVMYKYSDGFAWVDKWFCSKECLAVVLKNWLQDYYKSSTKIGGMVYNSGAGQMAPTNKDYGT